MPVTKLQSHSGLDLTWQGGTIGKIVHKRLRHKPGMLIQALDQIWPAAFFSLDQVDVYRQATPEIQHTVLAACARSTIEEAYFIEKAAISFAAKMTLLAESADERSLYALFGAEEANHLAMLGAALGDVDENCWRHNSFLSLLGDVTDTCDRRTGQLVIQVVLEGWGLTHYAALRDACLEPQLRTLFDVILKDEAAHHGSGLVLLAEERFDASATERALAPLAHMLSMVQMGPAMVIAALEHAVGGFSKAERNTFYTQLGGTEHTQVRLSKLRTLMEKVSGASPIVDALEARKLFSPLPLFNS